MQPLAAIYTRVSGPYDQRERGIEIQTEESIEKACKLGYRTAPEHCYSDRYTSVELVRPTRPLGAA
jgi:hypothetical protein